MQYRVLVVYITCKYYVIESRAINKKYIKKCIIKEVY